MRRPPPDECFGLDQIEVSSIGPCVLLRGEVVKTFKGEDAEVKASGYARAMAEGRLRNVTK